MLRIIIACYLYVTCNTFIIIIHVTFFKSSFLQPFIILLDKCWFCLPACRHCQFGWSATDRELMSVFWGWYRCHHHVG